MKFRKKPVVIEAHQYQGNNSNEVMSVLGMTCPEHVRFTETGGMLIQTLEGEHIASVGDWIIKGVKGEFYPCKPDIFELTYEDHLAALAQAVPSGYVLVSAAKLLEVQKALVFRSVEEAYNQLYYAVEAKDPYKPWAEWENAARFAAAPKPTGGE